MSSKMHHYSANGSLNSVLATYFPLAPRQGKGELDNYPNLAWDAMLTWLTAQVVQPSHLAQEMKITYSLYPRVVSINIFLIQICPI